MSAQRYRVVGSYWLSAWPGQALDGSMVDVDGTVRAGVPQGAVNVVGQVIVFNEPGAPRHPWDLTVFDEQGAPVLRFVEGIPREGL